VDTVHPPRRLPAHRALHRIVSRPGLHPDELALVRHMLDDRATRPCLQAVIIGSINDHCSSDKSLGYGSRSMPASQHAHAQQTPCAPISTSIERSRTGEDRT
jgi:hypothetical protein